MEWSNPLAEAQWALPQRNGICSIFTDLPPKPLAAPAKFGLARTAPHQNLPELPKIPKINENFKTL